MINQYNYLPIIYLHMTGEHFIILLHLTLILLMPNFYNLGSIYKCIKWDKN